MDLRGIRVRAYLSCPVVWVLSMESAYPITLVPYDQVRFNDSTSLSVV